MAVQMDAMTESNGHPVSTSGAGTGFGCLRDVSAMAGMPAPAPIEMPMQSLRRFDEPDPILLKFSGNGSAVHLARVLIVATAVALTTYGAMEMYGVISVGTTTTLEWMLLFLFVLNFAWISLAFATATIGFLTLLLFPSPKNIRTSSGQEPVGLQSRTAVVVPIYNEEPSRIFSAVRAMMEAVSESKLGEHFNWFILSDTTNPDIWLSEERAYLDATRQLPREANLYYRHRPRNTERKAGNIADFVMGWGAAYDHMLVLDADSQMDAAAIIGLARAMQQDPAAGIIQTLPLVVNRNTLFARLQQFAARVYGPVLAAGLSAWSGRDGNYWGHNAIIRIKAFANNCRLPTLKGAPPFGGHILSHDFVEAALIRRGGYRVYMLPHMQGSYEESPPSLIDLAIRDRRWCQGNLQHSRVIAARGLHSMNRIHLASGIMSYLSSPIWLAQLLVGIVIVLQSHYVRPEYFTDEFALLPAWPQFDAERALWLFALTMCILIIPKFYGLIVSLCNAAVRKGTGGASLLIASTLLEIILSALMAPIMMLIQTGSVFRILLGRDSGWNPQRRDDGGIPFGSIFRRHLSHTILGVIALVAGMLIAPSLVVWMSPTIAGLILASLISWASGQRTIGLALRRLGLLLTPEEVATPALIQRSRQLFQESRTNFTTEPALLRIRQDPDIYRWHERFLQAEVDRMPGDVDVARAVAAAKLADAKSLTQAISWLTNAEQNAVLNDRILLRIACKLPLSSGPEGG